MTRSQFASAVRTNEKWVENTARLLGKRLKYTPAEARWLGLVNVFNQETGVSLMRASELAHEALTHDPRSPDVILGQSDHGNTGISLELARYHSSFAASLSAALEFGGARRRGRPRLSVAKQANRLAVRNAARYGVDIVLLREGLRIPVADRLRLADENAAFVRELRSSVQGNA